MSLAAVQARAFVTEVVETGQVWAIRDSGGFPTSTNASGEAAMPFWSKESRARATIGAVDAYADFEPVELSLTEFIENWIPGLERDGLFVGLNWYGKRAVGYNFTPREVRARLEAARAPRHRVR